MGFVLSLYIFNVLFMISLIVAVIYFYNKKNRFLMWTCVISSAVNFYLVFKIGPEIIDKVFEVKFLENYVKHVM